MEKKLNFNDFEGVTKVKWVEKIILDLKGKSYESLHFNTDDNLVIEPFYTNSEIINQEFVFSPSSWNIRQDFEGEDLIKTNKKILESLHGGVNAIGVFSVFKGDLSKLLKDVQGDFIHLHINGYFFPEKIDEIAKLLQNSKQSYGTLDYTPLFDSYSKVDELDTRFWDTFTTSLELLPKYKSILVDVSQVLNDGGTTSQEIGIALAKGHEYIIALLEKGYSLMTIASQIHFKFAIGSSYFIEIAKIRAFRWTWNHLLSSYLPNDEKLDFPPTFIHAETSSWNKSVKDVYNNMLRSTTEAMSAVLGGVDSISVKPFDELYNKENDFSLRMARNTLNIIKEEAYLEAVQDVAGGSYYIETLTANYANAGWKFFQKIEGIGGAIEAIKKDWIEIEIFREAKKKQKKFALGEKVLLGVNKHPKTNDKVRKPIEDINRLERTDA